MADLKGISVYLHDMFPHKKYAGSSRNQTAARCQ
jgi:hypothetical protein